jgi:hypothetical protein
LRRLSSLWWWYIIKHVLFLTEECNWLISYRLLDLRQDIVPCL